MCFFILAVRIKSPMGTPFNIIDPNCGREVFNHEIVKIDTLYYVGQCNSVTLKLTTQYYWNFIMFSSFWYVELFYTITVYNIVVNRNIYLVYSENFRNKSIYNLFFIISQTKMGRYSISYDCKLYKVVRSRLL